MPTIVFQEGKVLGERWNDGEREERGRERKREEIHLLVAKEI